MFRKVRDEALQVRGMLTAYKSGSPRFLSVYSCIAAPKAVGKYIRSPRRRTNGAGTVPVR